MDCPNGAATAPSWRSDGKELLYVALGGRLPNSPGGKLTSVEIASNPVFRLGSAKPLFQLPGDAFRDISTDVERILLALPSAQNVQDEFNVVLNWTAALKKR